MKEIVTLKKRISRAGRPWAAGRKGHVLFLLVIPVFLYMVLLPVMPLMEPDEPRYSDIPSLMNRSGDYVTPRLNHVVYLEKPPLAYWATAFFFKLFGENDFSSRLFTGLSAWGCILLVYAMGRFLFDAKVGLYASGILSTFLYLFVLGRINLLDIPLTFFVSVATWGGFRYFAEETRRRRWICLFYGAAALAFLTKGVIGILFPPAIVGLWLVFRGRWRDVFGLFSLPGMAIFLVIATPWIVLVQKANSGFLHYFFIEEHLRRYASESHGRVSVFYYLPVLLLGTLPWLAHLLRVFLERRGEGKALLKASSHLFLLVWAGFILLFFSFSSAKIATYIAPVFLPLAVMFGRVFRGHEEGEPARAGEERRGFLPRLPVLLQAMALFIFMLSGPFLPKYAVPGGEWYPLVAVPIALVALTIFLPDEDDRKGWFPVTCVLWALLLGSTLFPLSSYLSSYKSSFPVARAVREFLPAREELYQYRIYLRGINYYCKIRTPIVGRANELQGKKHSLPAGEKARYFLTRTDFYEQCRQQGRLYCITKTGDMVDELRAKAGRVTVIWKNSAYCLLRLDCD